MTLKDINSELEYIYKRLNLLADDVYNNHTEDLQEDNFNIGFDNLEKAIQATRRAKMHIK